MNKELIKKYKAEFDHWLNGGKLLAKHNNKGWINYYGEDIWTHSTETLIVIDDEYSMFRKALIEEENIEVLQQNTERWVNIGTIIKSIKPELYRIKPKEPKFKVGDWVRDLRDNRVFQINSVNFNLKLSTTNGVYIHWQPKKGELVILKDKNGIISIIKYNGETDVYPFIGEITWLHKKD